jgi:MerR family transcriptional regulator, light-induced transcriptional regulator
VLLLGPGAPAPDLVELVDLERPDVVALSTATAGSLPGVVEVLGGLAELRPRPFVVVGGQFWTDETSAAAAEFGADAVVQDPRDLVAILRERAPRR